MRSDLIYIPDSELDALIQQDTPYLDLTTLGLDIGDEPGSLSFYLWEPMGLPYAKLIDKMVELALRAHAEKNRAVFAFDSNLLNQCALGQKGSKLHA